MRESDPITATEIKHALRHQLTRTRNGNTPRWAVFEELRLGTGFGRGVARTTIKANLAHYRKLHREGEMTTGSVHPLVVTEQIERFEAMLEDPELDRRQSRIDVFAMDCYESGNYERRAYEIKVSRGDLFSELRDPSKRAPWLELVTGFYFVIPKGLATTTEITELAPECGVMYYSRLPDKPKPRDLCTCPDLRQRKSSSAWVHLRECPYRDPAEAYEKAQRGRRINTARPAMKLDGTEPSWSLVASILRAAAGS